MGKKTFIVMFVLLVASIVSNAYLVVEVNQRQVNPTELREHVNSLEEANKWLVKELYETNLSFQQAREQLEVYRNELAELRARINRTTAVGEEGSAQLEAPAVMRRIQYHGNYPFYTREVVENGTMLKVHVDIKPGYGRVLVVTKPLMGVVFQDAANTAGYCR